MSEYQYYEFQAIDKPLSEKDREVLRDISSRAQITSTSFVNEYNYGNFNSDPLKLVAIRENHSRKSSFINRIDSASL